MNNSAPSALTPTQQILDRIITGFESVPTRMDLDDLGMIGQLLMLGGPSPVTAWERARLADACQSWLRSGLLKELLCMDVACTYPAALLYGFAQQYGRTSGTTSNVARLVEAKLLGAGEWSMMVSLIIRACLRQESFDLDPIIGKQMNRRVLRRYEGSYDLETILQYTHCQILAGKAGSDEHSQLVNVVIVRTLREEDSCTLAPLAFLAARYFQIPVPLTKAVRLRIAAFNPTDMNLSGAGLSDLGRDRFSGAAVMLRTIIALSLYQEAALENWPQ